MSAPTFLRLPLSWSPAKPPPPFMPLITVSSLLLPLIGFSAVFPMLLSIADGTPASYRIGGTGVSVALALVMLLGRKPPPQRLEIVFHILAAATMGFLLPKLVLPWLGFDIAGTDPDVWALASVLCGIPGPALLMAWRKLSTRSAPRLVEMAANRMHLPKDDSGAPEGGDVKRSRRDDISRSRRRVDREF